MGGTAGKSSSRPSRLQARKEHGLTLIELLAVMAIMFVLITLTVPGYFKFISKARRSEAKINLETIHQLEIAFHSMNGYYSMDFDEINFEIKGNSLYKYEVIEADEDSFIVRASSHNDALEITQTGIIKVDST